MKSYSDYKNTKFSELGKIPHHWNIQKMKWYFENIINGSWGDDPLDESQGVVVLRVADFDDHSISDNNLTRRLIDETTVKNKSLVNGDLIIEKSGGGEKTPVGRVVLFDKKYLAITSNFLARLRPNRNYIPKFVLYSLIDLYQKKIVLKSIKQTTGIQNLDFYMYSNESVAIPPNDEQMRIASYLDYKIQLIKTLIDRNQKQIELLEEKKQAMINQSVTKGLDPNVKMKDSGIEWIGTIPEHWQVGAIRYLVGNVSSGTTPRSDNSSYYSIEDGIPWIQSGDLKNKFLTQTSKNITDEALMDYSILRTYPKGSLVIAMYGATIGACSLTKIEATTNQACAVISGSIKIDHEFLYYVFLNAKKELLKLSVGGGQPNISQEIIKALHISFPKIEEQKNIVLFINEKLEGINKVIQKLTKQQELLYEYRQALISNVVTGKIDVRDEKIPEKYITNCYGKYN